MTDSKASTHQSSLATPAHQSSASTINHQSSLATPAPSAISHQSSVIDPNSPKRIWIINPFDQLPNESDVPLRYWALCRTLAAQGHDVIWWSSDFSHLTKTKRPPCPDTDGFSVRLIETLPYAKNISFARLKNHRQFAQGFYSNAMAALNSGELKAPDRIVVSLPPLGVAEQAFRIRDALRQCKSGKVGTYEGHRDDPESSHINTFPHSNSSNAGTPSHLPTQQSCQVVVDIMDAWPETFYQALPKLLRKALGPILLAPMHRSAKRAYQGADKISAVGQSYLELAKKYLGQKTDQSRSCVCHALGVLQPQHLGTEATKETTAKARRYGHQPSTNNNQQPTTPTHLCYHGTDLSRFQRDRSESETVNSESAQGTEDRRQETEDRRTAPPSHDGGHKRKQKSSLNKQQATSNKQRPTNTPPLSSQPSALKSLPSPLRVVYLGAMGSGYDLQTLIEVAARWKREGIFPFQIHFAGDGPQRTALEAKCEALGLLSNEKSDKSVASTSAISPPQTPLLGEEGCPKGGVVPDQPSHLRTWSGPLRVRSCRRSAPRNSPSHDSSSIDIPRVVFHGHLGKTPITVLLESADLALVPNRPASLVACPYKAGEYAAAGLPMLSCLGGELDNLLKQWNAGSEYEEGDAASLQAAFEKYSTDLGILKQQSLNAQKMAEDLFDREKTYAALAAFILG